MTTRHSPIFSWPWHDTEPGVVSVESLEHVATHSASAHATRAPSRVMFSANRGWARRTGAALRITDLPGMLAATISSAMATRMM